LPTATGCDSIINVNLNFLMEATVDLSPILCAGESIVVNGVVYDEDNPTGTEVLQAVNGCDSLVNVSLTFNDTITVELTPDLYPTESNTRNVMTYHKNNPTGKKLFTTSNGCDSLVL
ncbi:MAG: hypothetical protein KDC43_22650, partial [Saprospiraceae bacterium]|nr:hypothetical protein [Saprospiraceae bacterium]